MSPVTLMSPNGTNGNGTARSLQSQSWLQASVKEFFTAFNWDDQPLEVQEIKLQALTNGDEPLSLTLTVGQFFGAFPWDGTEMAAPLSTADPLMRETPLAQDSLTLDDFSDLF